MPQITNVYGMCFLSFMAGAVVGVIGTLMTLALCQTAAAADKRMEEAHVAQLRREGLL